jgi:hypothetical protein
LGDLIFLKAAPLSGGVLRESNPGHSCTLTRGFEMVLVGDASAREERAATNQTLFREINERVKELHQGFSLVLPLGEWICECADDTCTDKVAMSANEYEAIRNDGARFFVAPSDEHVWYDIERVTVRTANYWVVEKVGRSGAMAREADPRPHG